MTTTMRAGRSTDQIISDLEKLLLLKRLEDALAEIKDGAARIERRLTGHEQRLAEFNDRCTFPPRQMTDVSPLGPMRIRIDVTVTIDTPSGEPQPDDGLCDTCNEPMAYYHGPGTESGRICTYCDNDTLANWGDTDWGAA